MLTVMQQLKDLGDKYAVDLTDLTNAKAAYESSIASLQAQIAQLQANGVDPAQIQPLIDRLAQEEQQIAALKGTVTGP